MAAPPVYDNKRPDQPSVFVPAAMVLAPRLLSWTCIGKVAICDVLKSHSSGTAHTSAPSPQDEDGSQLSRQSSDPAEAVRLSTGGLKRSPDKRLTAKLTPYCHDWREKLPSTRGPS
jgi:hypothetical protein